MERHIKNYCDYFGIYLTDWYSCECGCGQRAEQFHHLEPRSSFGSKRKMQQDKAENIVFINHLCHERAHREPTFNTELKMIHRKNLLKHSNNKNDTMSYGN